MRVGGGRVEGWRGGLHIKTRQQQTAQRDLNIYTGEAGKKCNLFLITQPHINPMQRRSKLSLIAPFPSTQKCGVSERRAV